MKQNILFINVPFTQFNTPYPATPYLNAFMRSSGIDSVQIDLGIELMLKIFSAEGLKYVFDAAAAENKTLSPHNLQILSMRRHYIRTVDTVISFLQGKDPSAAYLICGGSFLPSASENVQDQDELKWAFGDMGISDKAKHLATLYIEEISSFIYESVDSHFGLTRYAEHLALSATEFDYINSELENPPSFTDMLLLDLLTAKIREYKPSIAAITVPFPGNLYSALRCGKWIKENSPETKVVIGGGYPNTELRSLKDPRVFDYTDYITLDDGEIPLLCLTEFLAGQRPQEKLKRTFFRNNGTVSYADDTTIPELSHKERPCPDYSGLPLDRYISIIGNLNPMHSLWNCGKWNKLALAHGCYWGKCSFCDSSLDYIKRFEASSPSSVCDQIEKLIKNCGSSGFHFVDEAAPPALLKELSIEIIRRGLNIAWWTNIRFDKAFDKDLCRLMKEAGCIAVSGGLEVASERILALINKGIDIQQAASVMYNFTEAEIMVHAYLMYGFPTQTAQETIDSLEIVRQLFANGLLNSGFWHRFAMTVHSETGRNPYKYGVSVPASYSPGAFANNELPYADKKSCDHIRFGDGLRTSLFNYMRSTGFDMPLQEWFNFKVPQTIIANDFIDCIIYDNIKIRSLPDGNKRLIWTGALALAETNKKNGKVNSRLVCTDKSGWKTIINMKEPQAQYLALMFQNLSGNEITLTVDEFKKEFSSKGLGSADEFLKSKIFTDLNKAGLLVI